MHEITTCIRGRLIISHTIMRSIEFSWILQGNDEPFNLNFQFVTSRWRLTSPRCFTGTLRFVDGWESCLNGRERCIERRKSREKRKERKKKIKGYLKGGNHESPSRSRRATYHFLAGESTSMVILSRRESTLKIKEFAFKYNAQM